MHDAIPLSGTHAALLESGLWLMSSILCIRGSPQPHVYLEKASSVASETNTTIAKDPRSIVAKDTMSSSAVTQKSSQHQQVSKPAQQGQLAREEKETSANASASVCLDCFLIDCSEFVCGSVCNNYQLCTTCIPSFNAVYISPSSLVSSSDSAVLVAFINPNWC